MSRFFCPPESIKSDRIYIKGKEAHHILDVMRLKTSDKVITFDGTGKEYTATIEKASNQEVVLKIVSTKDRRQEPGYKVTLACAIPKKSKMDYIVEKSTELGVDTIIPIITTRTIVRLDKEKKLTQRLRWRKIAVAASKQCGRNTVPEVEMPQTLKGLLDRVKGYDLAILACLEDKRMDFREVINRNISDFRKKYTSESKGVIIFIGPEGGFTPEEIKNAKSAGCSSISLGYTVLKTDTAAVATLAILAYELKRK